MKQAIVLVKAMIETLKLLLLLLLGWPLTRGALASLAL
jgi:hypothetical protein